MDILELMRSYLQAIGYKVSPASIGLVISAYAEPVAGYVALANLHRTRQEMLQLDLFYNSACQTFDPSDPKFDPAQIVQALRTIPDPNGRNWRRTY